MANNNEINIVIQVATAQGKAEIRDFTDSSGKKLDSFSKKGQSSIRNLGRSFTKYLGAAAAGAVVAKGFNRMIDKGEEFQQQTADLQAITGIAGKDLKGLAADALDTSVKYGESASNIIEANKLVASQLASKIDFNTEAGIQQLKDISTQAVVLQKAAGIDLKTAVQATTTALNQFNLKASDSDKVINSIAAGAKYGAAEARDQAQAYERAGSVFASAGEDLGTLNAATQILAQNALKGSDAGTGLRNVMLILENSATLAKNGINDLNVKQDGFIKSLRKLTPIQDDANKLTAIFGRENITAAQLLIKNVDAIDTMNTKIRGTNTAYEQAEVQLNTFKGASNQLSAAIDKNLIKSFQDANGVGVELIRTLTGVVNAVGDAIDSLNDLTDKKARAANIAGSAGQSKGFFDFLGTGDEAKAIQEAGKKLEGLLETSKKIKNQAGGLGLDLSFYTKQLETVDKGTAKYKSYERQIASTKQQLDALEGTIKHEIDAEQDNIASLQLQGNETGYQEELLRELNARYDAVTKANDATKDSSDKLTDGLKKQGEASDQAAGNSNAGGIKGLSAQIKVAKNQIDQLKDKTGQLTAADINQINTKQQLIGTLQNLQREREKRIELGKIDLSDATGEETQAKGTFDIASASQADPRISAEQELQNAISKTGKIRQSVAQAALAGDKAQKASLHQLQNATIEATSAAAARADNAKEFAHEFIKQIEAELIAIAIKKALASAPFPFNIALAGAAAVAAKGLFSLIPGFAKGGSPSLAGANSSGRVYGPGTTTSDSILARLSNREFVVNASSAQAMPDVLDEANRSPHAARNINRIYKEVKKARGFARGGYTMNTPPMPSFSRPSLSTIDRLIQIKQQDTSNEGFALVAAKIEDQTRRLEAIKSEINFNINEFEEQRRQFNFKQNQVGRK